MPVHCLLVERVDLRGLGGSAGGNDFLGDNLDGCQVAPGEKELGPLRGKGACDSAADRASGAVDHRNLVLQHHLWFLSGSGVVTGCPFRGVLVETPATTGMERQPLQAGGRPSACDAFKYPGCERHVRSAPYVSLLEGPGVDRVAVANQLEQASFAELLGRPLV